MYKLKNWRWLVLGLGLSAPLAAETVVVEIKKFAFIPEEVTVPVGTTIRWLNAEKRQYHSVWFESLDKEATDYFFPEETYEKTFTKAGVYPYRCGPHKRMKGTVVVVEEGASKAVGAPKAN